MVFSAVVALVAVFSVILAEPIKAVILTGPIVSTQGLDNAALAKVKTNLENIATHRRVRPHLTYFCFSSDLHK